MGGILASHTAVDKSIKKNQEYISEMNKLKEGIRKFYLSLENLSIF